MRTHPTHHLKSRGGSLTSRKGTPEDHLREEEEEDPHHAHQDHPQEEEEVVEVAAEAEEEEEGAERSLYPDMHLLNQLRNF